MRTINRGYIAYQPRLMVANSLTHSSKSYHLQLMIVNNTDKHNYEIKEEYGSHVGWPE